MHASTFIRYCFPNKTFPKNLHVAVNIGVHVSFRIVAFSGKEMATHSSTPAWKIPWLEKPLRLQSMGLQRVGYN